MDAVHTGGLGGTYGGNPVACAAALGAIRTMRERDLNAAARRIENTVLPRLREIASRSSAVAEVRGRGAMLAVEFTERTPDVATRVAKACHEQGVVVLTCGTYGNVIRLLPPLVIPDEVLAEGLDILEGALL